MPGFLDVLRETASSIATTAGETISLAGQVGAQRAREVVGDFLDVQEPPPQYTFTAGGVVMPGRPNANPLPGVATVQSTSTGNRINRRDANNEGATTTTDAGNAGFFGLRLPGSLGGSSGLLIAGGALALGGVLFLAMRR